MKYIFVTGGVVSSLGKGITAASLGRLLKSRGIRVKMLKLDPYLNVDPGTMSPLQHGEVFVTDDGAETDLDLGHYERFTDSNASKHSNVTTGAIYWSILTKERQGAFLGRTVQVIPHVTNEIKERIIGIADEDEADLVIVEIGGTVGDIEGLPFLEAIRQMKTEVGRDNCLYVHVTLVPYIESAKEVKTKPTQHSVKELRSIGIQPDVIVCRSEYELTEEIKAKIALFCDIEPKAVIPNIDVETIYEVPLLFQQEGLDDIVIEKLNLKARERDLAEWRGMVQRIKNPKCEVTVGLVGKYVTLPDAYLSIVEALYHGGIANNAKVNIKWINAEEIEENGVELLRGVDAVLVPGGFGIRGVEGKISTIQYCREKGVPFFGICLGLQCAVIEFARNVCGLKRAHSTEFDADTPYPVIHLLPQQVGLENKGGTMRLGLSECLLLPGTKISTLYDKNVIFERHRHRFEINNEYIETLSDKGMVFSGFTREGHLVESLEIPGHPWFVAVQFHPEWLSRPNRPHPLFHSFIQAALTRRGISVQESLIK
jgi:CTP synthase